MKTITILRLSTIIFISFISQNELFSSSINHHDTVKYTLPIDSSIVYIYVDKSAKFQGKEISKFSKYISNNFKYPTGLNHTNGRAVIQFVVDYNGNVKFVKVLVSSGYSELDKEAIRIISNSPQWTPAIYQGKIVSQYFTIPINFD